MADLIRIKCGELGGRNEMPTLQCDKELGAEMGYRTDEKALYIGAVAGNERLCGVGDVANINAKIIEIHTKIEEINESIANIITRLNALETPSE